MTHDNLALYSSGMTTQRWITEVPPVAVRLADLTPIQPPPTSYDPHLPRPRDPIPHVINVDGTMYIEDGHHRYYQAQALERVWMLARVIHRTDSQILNARASVLMEDQLKGRHE